MVSSFIKNFVLNLLIIQSVKLEAWSFLSPSLSSLLQSPTPFIVGRENTREISHSNSLQMMKQVQEDNGPIWCEEQQIYIDGTIASSSRAEEHINSILSAIRNENQGNDDDSNDKDQSLSSSFSAPSSTKQQLHIFGYGSLCWNPGSPDEVLANPKVRRKVAKAIGWKRCWCQKSTDHRGCVSFPGLVCTLLSDEEIASIKKTQKEGSNIVGEGDQMKMEDIDENRSMTEGVLYTIPSELVEQCLAELDFREKGGYARDVIDVVVIEEGGEGGGAHGGKEEEQKRGYGSTQTQSYYKALLYRGTPDNPAFSKRALLDPHYAAAIMAVAKGPSGSNDEYLFNLDDFLSTTITTENRSSSSNGSSSAEEIGDMQTKYLASLTHSLQTKHDVYFLFGAGSNQHDQLLLASAEKDYYGDFVNSADLINGEDAHLLTDIVLITPKGEKVSPPNVQPKTLFCGGGHSAMLSEEDDLYLWGWNEFGQLGRSTDKSPDDDQFLLMAPVIGRLDIKVATAALGHSHTLVIEKSTGRLLCFGDDGRGQVSGVSNASTFKGDAIKIPTTPTFATNDRFIDIDAGVFHSAAITAEGELVTFGCGRFGQSLPTEDGDHNTFGRWKPDDGSMLTKVACGRRHTMVLDEYGRIWTMGENKYGQLGRSLVGRSKISHTPELVDGFLGKKGSGCVDIDCGWSHSIATIRERIEPHSKYDDGKLSLYAWGRNDKHQFGTKTEDTNASSVDAPQFIVQEIDGKSLDAVCCGAESVMILDTKGEIYGCGWNEHGNLAVGHDKDIHDFTKLSGAKIRNFNDLPSSKITMAAGGAHFLATLI